MSTATAKRSHAQALADAEAFRDLFAGCYERWEFAGSLRRRKAEVSDIEHVVIPRIRQQSAGLFGAMEPVNLLWESLDAMVENRVLSKHLYVSHMSDGSERIGPRWGQVYRGIDFNGFNHEIWTADATNFGCILVIRTGSADFSHRMVTNILRGGLYRQQDGGLVHVKSGERVNVPDEHTFFKLAGAAYMAPEART